MKKMLTMILALMMLVAAIPAQADEPAMRNPIPEEIAALFDVPAWEDYYIPVCTDLPDYYAFTQSGDGALIVLRKDSDNRNVLCLLEYKSGKWRISARNFEALPRGEEVPYLYCEIPDQLEVYWGNWKQGTSCSLFVAKKQGKWVVSDVANQAKNLSAYVRNDAICYNIFSEDGKEYLGEKTAYGVFDNRFAAFNWAYFPQTVEEAREKLTNPPVTPTDFYTPVTLTLRANEKYDVFAAPGRDSYRSANGKAVMSTNDWVQIFGEEDGWLLVQYDISRDQMRFGYIDASALPRNAEAQTLTWYDLPEQTIKYGTNVTDDPLVSCGVIHHLSSGDRVRVLSAFGSWYYIETTDDSGKLLRGFVPKSCIDIVTDDEMVG